MHQGPPATIPIFPGRQGKKDGEGRPQEERHTDQKGIELAGGKERTIFFSLSSSRSPSPFSLLRALSSCVYSRSRVQLERATVTAERNAARKGEREKKAACKQRRRTIDVQMKIQITHAYVSRGSSRASSIG